MAGNLADYAELKILEHSVGKTSWTMPAGCWAALYTANPSDTGGGTEVSASGTAYARVQTNASWAAASAGSITTNADLVWATATGAGFGTVTAVALLDSATVGAGNFLWWGTLASSKAVGTGDVFKILTGQLTLTLD